MKKYIFLIILFAVISFINTGCSVLEGRPEANNTEQAVGTSPWWEDRQNAELNAQQLNDQFGDQGGNDNNSYLDQDAVYTNRQDFDFLKKDHEN